MINLHVWFQNHQMFSYNSSAQFFVFIVHAPSYFCIKTTNFKKNIFLRDNISNTDKSSDLNILLIYIYNKEFTIKPIIQHNKNVTDDKNFTELLPILYSP